MTTAREQLLEAIADFIGTCDAEAVALIPSVDAYTATGGNARARSKMQAKQEGELAAFFASVAVPSELAAYAKPTRTELWIEARHLAFYNSIMDDES